MRPLALLLLVAGVAALVGGFALAASNLAAYRSCQNGVAYLGVGVNDPTVRHRCDDVTTRLYAGAGIAGAGLVAVIAGAVTLERRR